MKKLDFMHTKDDMNVLNRNEMRSIMAGSGGCGSTCTCSYNGCNVGITQYSGQWHMVVQCAGDSSPTHYNGCGQYGGTACGGSCP